MGWQHLATILGLVLGVVVIARVLGQRESPSVTIAWLLLMLFVPYVGVPLYLLLGTRKLRGALVRKQPLYARDAQRADAASDRYGLAALLAAGGHPPARPGNRVELTPNGEDAWRMLLAAIHGAERSIWVCTFQLKKDAVARAIVDALAARASAGIEVRLLMDGVGSWRTRRRFTARLRRAGGHVAVFLPVWPVARPWSANLRNHRKSVVVDGRIAFVGGMNLGACYLGPTPDPSRWVDTLAKVEGPAVSDVAEIFRRDWQFAAQEELPPVAPPPEAGTAMLRIVASGPDTAGDALSDVLTLALVGARRRIWAMTPYLVPDQTILHALLLAARRGADVRVVLPRRSDHFVADLARGRALRSLAEAGARVLLHPNRMIHAKVFIFDDDLAMLGSANLDRRSLYLNHELTVLVETPAEVEALAAWTEHIMAGCEESAPKPESSARLLVEDVTAILAPLI
ncbi:MAG: phospholipase D-like domain-containing protein [Planctomycetota bacterium]|nr:phospholipase D-like domain-containing protein [Planctomycetota bacterium]